jgi:uncharacterized protein (TIGR02217 family)
MTDFIETPRFPSCPKFGHTSFPDYSVTPIRTASGWERRNANWDETLLRFEVTVGPGPDLIPEIQELIEFWHAVGGNEIGFRYKDPADYKSCYIGSEAASSDQPLVQITGATYQLTKRYTAGAQTRDRSIKKPVSGTILIEDDGVLKTETTHYTIDYTTGIVTLLFTPTSTGDLAWGGEFDCAVRFDGPLPIQILDAYSHTVTVALGGLRT